MSDVDYQPVIIIGAPRSGTNMLRDILTQLPSTGTWPCDEINYIWRHGNIRYPSDEFTPEMARPEIVRYIQRQFDLLAKKYQLDTVVEKTCANSMRVGFVDKIMPNARYIFMVRDGLDVIGSAMLRWTAQLDIPYLLKKARYVPSSDLPYYASRYLYNRFYRLFSLDKQLAFWGPQMENMKTLLAQYNLSQVCALQWQTCVNNSIRDFELFDTENIIQVQYESFVQQPVSEMQRISYFLGKPLDLAECERLTANVSSKSIGKGRAALHKQDLVKILPLIDETLKHNGYSF